MHPKIDQACDTACVRTKFRIGVTCWLLLGAVQNFAPHASAASRCRVESAASLRFGAYTSTDHKPLDTTSYVSYSCHDVDPGDVIYLQFSRSRSGDFMPRRFTGPGPGFEYNIYLDAARTAVWGDGTAGTVDYEAHPPEGRTVTVPVYGRIAPGQNVWAGAYDDTLVVTLVY